MRRILIENYDFLCGSQTSVKPHDADKREGGKNTIYPEYRAYVLRKNSQQIPLALYYPDANQELPVFWTRDFKYNIE